MGIGSWSQLKTSVLQRFSRGSVDKVSELKTDSPVPISDIYPTSSPSASQASQASPTLPQFDFSSEQNLASPPPSPPLTRPFSSVGYSTLNILQQPVTLGSQASPTLRQRNRNTITFPISKLPPVYQPQPVQTNHLKLNRTLCTGTIPKTPPLPNKNSFLELLDHFTLLHPLLYSPPSSMVYSVIKKSTLQVNTARIFKKMCSYETQLEYRKRLHKEINLTSQLEHPNILKLLDVCFHFNLPFVITEGGYFEGTGLLELAPLPLSSALCLVSDLLEGLNYLHKKRVAHLDLNLSNLAIFYNGTLKITNFSNAIRLDSFDKQTSLSFIHAKPHSFSSPELVSCQVENFDMLACDVWAAGIIGLITLTGRPPWPLADKNETLFANYLSTGTITALTVISPYHTLLLGMLNINVSSRMTIAQALDFFIYLDNPAHTMLGDLATVYI